MTSGGSQANTSADLVFSDRREIRVLQFPSNALTVSGRVSREARRG